METALDYTDDKGMTHVMCACGHTISGGVKPGQKIALCPNCQLLLRVLGKVEVVYPDRLPKSIR